VAEENPIHQAVHDGGLDALGFASLEIVRDQMSRVFLRSYTLDDLHFVGIVERYDDDLERLGALLGWPRVDAMHVNRTSAPGYDGKLDPGLVAAIRELNPADVALYEDALHRRERR
jgi:hypothetical protein